MTYENDELSQQVIGLAIQVHRHLGPGLLESAHEECLCLELKEASVPFRRQVPLPIIYESIKLDCGYRLDVVVKDQLILELNTVERLLPIHNVQLLTYMKLSGIRTGSLLNFSSAVLKDGLRRLIL